MPIPTVTFEPSVSEKEALERAGALWRVEPEYWDIWGKRHATPPEVRKAILLAMGIPCETVECLNRAIEERLWREWSSVTPPTLVVSSTANPAEFPLTVPSAMAGHSATVEVLWEDGSKEQYELSLADLPKTATAELRGQSFVRKRVPLPERLPLGYHGLQVTVRSGRRKILSGTTRLIVCPDKAWTPPELKDGGRLGGLAVSLYGVRSQRNWGCGDFTDLLGVIDWVADELGGAFVALNPLHAILNRQPFNTSPYLPTSIFFRNALYLDVEKIQDFRNSRAARDLFAGGDVQAELAELREAPFVEYERVYSLKVRFLRLAFDSFRRKARAGSERAAQFEEYCGRQGELLERYATFRALEEWLHVRNPDIWVWPDWPAEYRDPDSKAVQQFARKQRRLVDFYKYAQWQAELQLAEAQEHARRRGMPIGLYHDLALATDRCGADFWAYRPFFVSGCRVGAPPDDFSPNGQDWSFPPPNTEHHREDGYRLFIESIRRNFAHGGALRIDHVMRFFRLFWIPEGMKAAQGTYVGDLYEDLLRILALESVRQKVLIVGEDLGTVEPAVRDALRRFGILSYRLLYFERKLNGELIQPQEYPRAALVSVTTHDLPTLAGFWLGADIEARRHAGVLANDRARRAQLDARAGEKQHLIDALFAAGLLPEWFPRSAAEVPELTGELHNAVVGFISTTPSMMMALTQEDLLKEVHQQNLPGTTAEYPNWRRKMRFTLEELRTEELARGCAAMFRNWLERTGRTR